MRDRGIEMAVRVSHQAQQVQRVRLIRHSGEHAPAQRFGLRGLASLPVRVRA